jgi:hypothetical protein
VWRNLFPRSVFAPLLFLSYVIDLYNIKGYNCVFKLWWRESHMLITLLPSSWQMWTTAPHSPSFFTERKKPYIHNRFTKRPTSTSICQTTYKGRYAYTRLWSPASDLMAGKENFFIRPLWDQISRRDIRTKPSDRHEIWRNESHKPDLPLVVISFAWIH